jgi:peptidyl-prolyl cis-trans isomerase D
MSQEEKKVSNIKSAAKIKEHKYKKRQQKMMIGTITILIIVVISFVVVPAMAGSGSSGGGQMVFGKYGKQSITFQQGNYFSQQVESVNNMYRDSMGTDGNVDFLRQLIWRSAFNQTVVRTAILDEVTEAGITVSSRGIDRGIVEGGMFNNNGRFDEDAYMATSGTRLKEIRKSLEEDIKVQTYYVDTLYNQKRSNAMMDFLLDMGSIEKNFSYARLDYSAFPEEQVINFGKDNENVFEEINLNRISIRSSEDEAATILKKLESGEKSFEDLARTYSTDSYSDDGGSMGSTFKYTLLSFLSEEQSSAIMALSTGKHSEVISSDNSWYIFQAAEDAIKPDYTDTAMVSTIRSYMEREEIGVIEDYLMMKAEEMAVVAHISSFAEAAAQFATDSGDTGFIAPVYGNVPFIVNSPGNKKDSSLLSAAAYSDEFFDKVFILKTPGETSQPIILDRSVVVFGLIAEQEGFTYPEEYQSYVRAELGSELGQYKQSALQGVFLESPKFKDNFNKTYGRIFAEES